MGIRRWHANFNEENRMFWTKHRKDKWRKIYWFVLRRNATSWTIRVLMIHSVMFTNKLLFISVTSWSSWGSKCTPCHRWTRWAWPKSWKRHVTTCQLGGLKLFYTNQAETHAKSWCWSDEWLMSFKIFISLGSSVLFWSFPSCALHSISVQLVVGCKVCCTFYVWTVWRSQST